MLDTLSKWPQSPQEPTDRLSIDAYTEPHNEELDNAADTEQDARLYIPSWEHDNLLTTVHYKRSSLS